MKNEVYWSLQRCFWKFQKALCSSSLNGTYVSRVGIVTGTSKLSNFVEHCLTAQSTCREGKSYLDGAEHQKETVLGHCFHFPQKFTWKPWTNTCPLLYKLNNHLIIGIHFSSQTPRIWWDARLVRRQAFERFLRLVGPFYAAGRYIWKHK